MSDIRISPSNSPLRGLDTLLHKAVEDKMPQVRTFAEVLQGVVGDANSTDAAAHESIESMATGDYDQDMVMLNSTKAELSLSLVVQIRDKVVDAYNEVMRMQV